MVEKDHNPRIFIILPVHNRIAMTKKFIERLKRQTNKNYRLILIDDGSVDGTADYVANQIDRVKILHGNGNLWWAGALSLAYSYLAQCNVFDDDLVLIVNDDVLFERDYLAKVIGDEGLGPESIVVSPGKSLTSDFVERGFAVDWRLLRICQLEEGGEPDAITTRGLYMHYRSFKSIGSMYPLILPHYLSDLEYTMRAKKCGYRLIVSEDTSIYVDRSSTGIHEDNAKTLKEFFYNHLISKKTAFNSFYWGNFILLACPWEYKIINFLKVYYRFFIKLGIFFKRRYVQNRAMIA